MESKAITQVLMVVGALLLVGVLAGGIGWLARAMFNQLGDGAAPEPTAAPTAFVPETSTSLPIVGSPTVALIPSATVGLSTPADPPAQTSPNPTSTPRPTATLSPTPALRTYTVRRGDTLARIAGNECPHLDSWQERSAFAREIARHSGISYMDKIWSGMVLVIPPCPH